MLLSDSQWRKNIESLKQISPEKVNPALIFEKYFLWGVTFNGFPSHSPNKYENMRFEHFNKILGYKIPLSNTQYNYLKNRKNLLPETRSFLLNTKTRVIVNHGDESIFENSIALHPYYGFPIIPGSAIKGVTSHYCKEFENLDRSSMEQIFGVSSFEKNSKEKNSKKGSILFFDAWPVSINQKQHMNDFFELDVFTQHYQSYYTNYKKNIFPGDNQDPVPVYFLAVKKGVEFEFSIAPSSECSNENLQIDLEYVEGLIRSALKTSGIGAKTGSSYGYFEEKGVC